MDFVFRMEGVFSNQHFSGFSHPVLIQYNNLKRNIKIWKVVCVVHSAGVTDADVEDVRSSGTRLRTLSSVFCFHRSRIS